MSDSDKGRRSGVTHFLPNQSVVVLFSWILVANNSVLVVLGFLHAVPWSYRILCFATHCYCCRSAVGNALSTRLQLHFEGRCVSVGTRSYAGNYQVFVI